MDTTKAMREMAEANFEYTNICIKLFQKLNSRRVMRYLTAVSHLIASIDYARSAFLLIWKDTNRSWIPARILFRCQTDLLMRGAFFAGPSTDEEYKYFEENDEMPKRDGNRLGPKSLVKINNAYFQQFVIRNSAINMMEKVTSDDWGPTSALAHGGHHLLGRYIGEDGIGMREPDPEFRRHINNSMIGVAYAMYIVLNYLATNKDGLKKEIELWEMATELHLAKWGTRLDSLVDGFPVKNWWEKEENDAGS
jgi:hypothetical protein